MMQLPIEMRRGIRLRRRRSARQLIEETFYLCDQLRNPNIECVRQFTSNISIDDNVCAQSDNSNISETVAMCRLKQTRIGEAEGADKERRAEKERRVPSILQTLPLL